ncbi:MAG: tyrosine-type recombinase/integrase [Candidatus Pelethousia sp.]|nr:tyrosine-type recombinase/integrase [Candidatus Pelethousia sp.]
MKRKQIVGKSISIQESFAQFQRFNQTKNLSPETIRYHDNHSKPFFAFLEDVSQPVDSITKEKIDAYILHLKAKGTVNDTTINTRLRMVRGFLYYCMKRGLMPNFQIAQIRTTQPVKEPYTKAELALLLKKPNIKSCSFARYRNWVIVNFLLATGCRASTLVNIRIEDIDLAGGMVLFRHMKTRTQQVVPLSKTIIGILEEYLAYRDGQPAEPLFISEYGNALKVDTLDSCIREYNLSCGVEKTSLHLFRHTYAKLFITAGGDPFRLQKLLGHSDLTMTKRYVALYAEDLKENYDKLNPLEQLSTGRNGNRVKLNVAHR